MDQQATATMKRTSDASVQLIRQVLDAFNRRDAAAAADLLTDDIEWHEIGRADPIIGKEALAARFDAALPEWDIRVDPHDILANDDHGVALVTGRSVPAGRSPTTPRPSTRSSRAPNRRGSTGFGFHRVREFAPSLG